MQTLQMIDTIKWIEALFPEHVKRALFTYEYLQGPGFVLMNEDEDEDEDETIPHAKTSGKTKHELTTRYIKATHELARISDVLSQNPLAIEILTAFNLELLTKKDFSTEFAISVLREGEMGAQSVIATLSLPWRLMTSCVEPIKQLVIPPDLTSEETTDEIITVTIQTRDEETPSLNKIATALKSLESAYSSIAEIYGVEEQASHLQVLKIESGSAVRIDSKGLGLVVKHLKEFFIEAWHKFRHKKSEEVIENNRAALSTISAVQEIEAGVQRGTMSRELGEILKRRMIEETLGLFGSGALIIEIPQQEVLDNTKLLREFGVKLLMPPKEAEPSSEIHRPDENHDGADIAEADFIDVGSTPAPPRPSGKKVAKKKQSTKKKKS